MCVYSICICRSQINLNNLGKKINAAIDILLEKNRSQKCSAIFVFGEGKITGNATAWKCVVAN